ncbi:MAG: TetR/AcrR family transcriptional regulator [Burkholderiaceae bacterium]|nr:TetR/AcrR family transcriptional regulator [Burkholderiaceae bacterium]
MSTPAVPGFAPLTPARRRIHTAAMKLFAEHGVTRVNISELAAAAGMARGTIYSHVPDIEGLFEEVAAHLAREMNDRVGAGFSGIADPAQRLSIGVRQYLRRAHEEPPWGRFMSRFGLSHALLQSVMGGRPLADLVAGIESRRYALRQEQLPAMVGLLAGGTLAAMPPVLDGHSTWRDIGAHTVELMLVALGLGRDEAKSLAGCELPPLAEMA